MHDADVHQSPNYRAQFQLVEVLVAVEQWNTRRGVADPKWKAGLYLGVLGLLNVLSVLHPLRLRWWTDLLLNSAPIAKYAFGAPLIAVFTGLWLLLTRSERYEQLRALPSRPAARIVAASYGAVSVAGFLLALVLPLIR